MSPSVQGKGSDQGHPVVSLYWVHYLFYEFFLALAHWCLIEWWSHMNDNGQTCLKQPFRNRLNEGLKDRWQLNAGLKYCRMLPRSLLQYFWPALGEFQSWKSFLLSSFEWPFKTGLTVIAFSHKSLLKRSKNPWNCWLCANSIWHC